MSTPSIAKSRNLKTATPTKRSVKSNATSRRKVASAAATTPLKADEPKVERVTEQERLLTLLNQAEGASIEEMMQATDWQQHSVRGFLAGTVKKKLGFSLATSKAAGDVRRYRVETIPQCNENPFLMDCLPRPRLQQRLRRNHWVIRSAKSQP